MKKKVLLALLALCVAASCTAFAACNQGNTTPDTPDTPPEPATKTDNTVVLDDISDINCGESPVLSATAEDGATITYVFSLTEDGEYKALPESFTHGEYYIKAIAAETEKHNRTTSAAKKFTANEKLAYWDEERSDEYDYGVCECGELIENVTFKKLVEGVQRLVVSEMTDLQMPSSDNVYRYNEKYLTGAVSLGDIAEKARNISEITLGEASLGNDISALDFSGLTDKRLHGEQRIAVEAEDEYGYTHKILVPVLLVTREISSSDELDALLSGQGNSYKIEVNGVLTSEVSEREDGSEAINNVVNGYYELTSDIDYKGHASGVEFRGTFDGAGHKIICGSEARGSLTLGLFNYLESATVKNLVLDAAHNNPAMSEGSYKAIIARFSYNTTFENVTINYVAGEDGTASDYIGFLFNQNVVSSSFKNFTINANGKKLGSILGGLNIWGSNPSIESLVFENFVINDCSGIGCLVRANGEKIQPWEAKGISGDVVSEIATDEVLDPESEEVLTVSLGEAYASLTDSVKSVVKTAADGTEEDVTDYCNFTADGVWFYESDIATEADRRSYITLTVVYEANGMNVTVSIKLYVVNDVSYNVTFVQKSGLRMTFSVREGGTVTFPEPELAEVGERFFGWKTSDGVMWKEDMIITGDMTLTAVYVSTVYDTSEYNETVMECAGTYDSSNNNGFEETSEISAPNGFENVFKSDSCGGLDFGHVRTLDGYAKVCFALKSDGKYKHSAEGEIDGQGRWVYFELSRENASSNEWTIRLIDDGNNVLLEVKKTDANNFNTLCGVLWHGGAWFEMSDASYVYCTELRGVGGEKIINGELVAERLFAEATEISITAPAGYEKFYKFASADGTVPFESIDITSYSKLFFEFKLTAWAQFAYPAEAIFYSTGEGKTTKVLLTRKSGSWEITFTGENVLNSANEYVSEITITRSGNDVKALFADMFCASGAEFTVTELRGELGQKQEYDTSEYTETVMDCAGTYDASGNNGFETTAETTAPKGFENVFKSVSCVGLDFGHVRTLDGYTKVCFALKSDGKYKHSDMGEIDGRGKWVYFEFSRETASSNDWTVRLISEDGDVLFEANRTDTNGFNTVCGVLWHGGAWFEMSDASYVYCTELRGVK